MTGTLSKTVFLYTSSTRMSHKCLAPLVEGLDVKKTEFDVLHEHWHVCDAILSLNANSWKWEAFTRLLESQSHISSVTKAQPSHPLQYTRKGSAVFILTIWKSQSWAKNQSKVPHGLHFETTIRNFPIITIFQRQFFVCGQIQHFHAR